MEINKIYQGNSLDVLKTFPDEFFDSCITSPPYWSQRSYNSNPQIWGGDANCPHEFIDNTCRCGAWLGELGHEKTPEMFCDHLIMIFNEVKRVLKKTGTCFIVIDDSFKGSNQAFGDTSNTGKQEYIHKAKALASANGKPPATNKHPYIKNKSLCLIPERFAIKMLENGWILRNKIAWVKLNAMPESCLDRFSTSYEYVYFFVKNQNYFFEQQFEPMKESSILRAQYDALSKKTESGNYGGINLKKQKEHFQKILSGEYVGRNFRDVWTINVQPFHGNHYAVYPPKLIFNIINAGVPEYICTKCGTPRKRIYKKEKIDTRPGEEVNTMKSGNEGDPNIGLHTSELSQLRQEIIRKPTGYTTCGCKEPEYASGVVLDPFMGVGTTGLVAQQMNRNYVGIEINPKTIEYAEKRLHEKLGLFQNLTF